MQKDLRSYLASLTDDFPGELLEIGVLVDPKWEVSAIIHRLQENNRFLAFLFESVTGNTVPIVSNLPASRTRLAAIIDTTQEEMLEGYVKHTANPLKPELIDSGPVQEVVQTGDRVDGSTLPIVFHAEKDGVLRR